MAVGDAGERALLFLEKKKREICAPDEFFSGGATTRQQRKFPGGVVSKGNPCPLHASAGARPVVDKLI